METDARMIPCLLLQDRSFVKTVRFANPRYLGDPINIVRVFNEKEVDELCILDISATRQGRRPAFGYLAQLAEECFMPLSYGGGIVDVEDCRTLFRIGIEKVVLNSHLSERPELVRQVADIAGEQSVVVAVDVRRAADGSASVWTHGGSRDSGEDPVRYSQRMQALGAGEILLTAIDRDGTMQGYDQELVRAVASAVDVPVVASGGARDMDDMVAAVRLSGASAVAAGSLFVFHGKLRAVLINPPSSEAFHAALSAAEPG